MNLKAGQGGLSVVPARRTRLIAAVALIWVLLLLALGIWWTRLLWTQARQIAELEAALAEQALSDGQWARTQLMLAGESGFALALLLALTGLLAWLYWREQRRARATQAFFAAVTHELRTPLTSIRLQAEALAEGDQRAELAQRLLEDTHRLESQIDKTLELARLEGGGPLSEQSIPLQQWLPRVAADLCAAHGARLRWEANIPADLPPVAGDAAALQMIFRNLVENAVRHSGREPVRVQVQALATAASVRLRLGDDGAGLNASVGEIGRLYGRGPQSAGAGIGLYLVRVLMQRMGGSAHFGNSGESGFAIELELPISRDAVL